MLSRNRVVTTGRRRLLALLILWLPLSGWAQQVEVKLEGDYPELKTNAEAFIGEVEGRNATNLRRYASTAVDQASKALRALGYYEPRIDWRVEDGDSDDGARLILTITPGEPVRVTSRTVEIRGAASRDSRFTDNLPKQPAEGDVLNHGHYNSLRDTIQTRARQRGYFDGGFVEKSLT
ncbi:MAG: POTRA domain-containing protein, partial [Marinobacter alexandrii]